VREIMTRVCPTCDGDGVVLSEETVAIEFERRLREIAARAPRATEAFLVRMNPHVSSEFTGQGSRMLHALEAETGKHFHFTGSEGLPLEHFDIVLEGTLADVREQAIPFRAGDEVLVTIVEPHMYAVDDAVAKIDGYIISVTGGGIHVGEKRLVRIEEAGRTAAVATIVDNGTAPVPAPAKVAASTANGGSGGDDVESKPRRRGRRGGRRRSAAKAAEADAPSAD